MDPQTENKIHQERSEARLVIWDFRQTATIDFRETGLNSNEIQLNQGYTFWYDQ